MCEQLVAAAVKPACKRPRALRSIGAAYTSLAQRQLREHRSFEPWIDAHRVTASGHRGQSTVHRRAVSGGGQLDEGSQCGGRNFVTHQELERKRASRIERARNHSRG